MRCRANLLLTALNPSPETNNAPAYAHQSIKQTAAFEHRAAGSQAARTRGRCRIASKCSSQLSGHSITVSDQHRVVVGVQIVLIQCFYYRSKVKFKCFFMLRKRVYHLNSESPIFLFLLLQNYRAIEIMLCFLKQIFCFYGLVIIYSITSCALKARTVQLCLSVYLSASTLHN